MTLAILAVLLCGAGAPDAGAAEDQDGGAPPEYQTVVTALRLPRPQADTPAATSVLPREEIARSPVLTADDLARELPSVGAFRQSSSLGADPSSQNLNLRGLSPTAPSRALLLLDGIPVNDPYGGWIYWRSLPLLAIDRIEVSPGGASALYGNFALGGVAQILSRPIAAPQAEAQLSGGSFDTWQAALRGAGRFGPVGAEVAAETLDSAGYNPIAPGERGPVDGPASSQDVSVGTRLELHPSDHVELRAFGRFFDEGFNTGTEFTNSTVRAGSYGASLTAGTAASGLWNAALFGGNREFDHDAAKVAPNRSSASLSDTQSVPMNDQGASLTWTAPPLRGAGEHTLLVGTDLRRAEGTSTDVFPATASPGALTQRSAGGEQQFGGLFVQDEARLPLSLVATAAFRLDEVRNLGGGLATVAGSGVTSSQSFPVRSELQPSPRLGLLAHLGDALSLRASGYRSFRVPTLDELYRPFQVGTILTDANPNLTTETLWGGEAGAELAVRSLLARATGFWNQIDSPIDNVTLPAPLPDGATRQRQNLGAARVPGVELEVGWRPEKQLSVLVAYTYVDPVVTSAANQPQLVGKQLALDPQHRGTAEVTYREPKLFTFSVELRALGPEFEDDRNTLPIAGHLVVDASISRDLHYLGFVAFATVTNLFDQTYLVGRSGVDTIGEPFAANVGLRWNGSLR